MNFEFEFDEDRYWCSIKMALLQAVLSDPSQTIVTYPTVSIDDDSDHLAKQNVFQRIRKNWRQFLNILPGSYILADRFIFRFRVEPNEMTFNGFFNRNIAVVDGWCSNFVGNS